MSSQYPHISHLFSSVPTTPPSSSVIPTFHHHHQLPLLLPGFWFCGDKDKQVRLGFRRRCNAISNPRSQEPVDLLHQQNGLPVISWPYEIVGDETTEEGLKVSVSNDIIEYVKSIKSMLGSMEDGEISISAYDTAWVALVEDLEGNGTPQFPSSLRWIANNQLPDGSWGDGDIFEAHDRLINTLACVIALKSWNLHPDKCEKGMSFFKENLCKLEDENPEHMPIGFEVAFPSLLELARKLELEVPDDSRILREIYARRDLKLTKIPKEIMHNVPTTLLHSLEGMPGLNWEKLLKLQCKDGSFLFSPSSTAFSLMQTNDENCLQYLNKVVQRFGGGVPNVYPVDLFEHIWVVDRLQRLGISRYFQAEIEECVNYIHRYWTKTGICWARNSVVHDLDDTAMGFRLLRLHGYDVSPDVFKHFVRDGKFVCFAGQSTQAVTGMFNLFRATQLLFPGEEVLEDGKQFSSKFLREKQAANELVDKWIIMKDLPGEVGFALDVPWYATLPRVETRFYIEQYGGQDDVWIGKTLYRMPNVNNNEYLQLAKLDYNSCQALHRIEWDNFQKWYEEYNLREYGVGRRTLLLAYFIAAASIFEPEKSKERLAWAKTTVLLETIGSYFDGETGAFSMERKDFVHEFINGIGASRLVNGRKLDTKRGTREVLVRMLHGTIYDMSVDELVAHGRDISSGLRQAWEKWLVRWEVEGDRHKAEGELLVQTIQLLADPWAFEEHLMHHPQYEQLANLTNKICHQIVQFQKRKVHDKGSWSTTGSGYRITTQQIESDMQELVQLILQNSSDGTNSDIKQTFLAVAKSFYYAAFCDLDTINQHIAKVLFERVE
ncbi:(-)-kolavenyl diphosphate synthase tps28, chloroplastic [Turnera subulata]|uniref:(-)-kolavenyl diphosphate synthase tps28, chloroplastic n=1 Tax=Turnera subulata TaxID=218843 RepID=A0A9Q0GAG6_9ROSI|nr:(-)-kolavenyl diphosphate synthase tps28, chloroplastic [Turnera subulata]